jgi:hypothetical protein
LINAKFALNYFSPFVLSPAYAAAKIVFSADLVASLGYNKYFSFGRQVVIFYI